MSMTKPNILLLCTDQQRPDWTGMNEELPFETPNIESLASRGTSFQNAVCPTPICNPSRACIASGYEYPNAWVRGNHMDYQTAEKTHQEMLRDEAGYHVMGCGKFDLEAEFNRDLTGDHRIEEWGFSEGVFNPAKNNTVARVDADLNGEPRDPYTQFLANNDLLETHIADYRNRGYGGLWKSGEPIPKNYWTATFPTPLPDYAYYDNWITQNAIDLLTDAPADQPWYLEVNFQNPHLPMDVTDSMLERFASLEGEFPSPTSSSGRLSSSKHQEIRRNYSAMIEHIDRSIGRILDVLGDRNEVENTVIVFCSDHGEMLGDYGLWRKSAPYQQSIGIPLVIAGPSIENREPVNQPATILDLHATFLDLAGLSPKEDADSRSMKNFLTGEVETHRDVVFSALSSWRLAFDGRYKLIEGFDPEFRERSEHEPDNVGPSIAQARQEGREKILYDVETSEANNIADENPSIVRRLEEKLGEI